MLLQNPSHPLPYTTFRNLPQKAYKSGSDLAIPFNILDHLYFFRTNFLGGYVQ